MSYRAIDVANFIVKDSLDNGRNMTNLKLQKILYYIQARFLVDSSSPLFFDRIEKWRYGPVVSSVYHNYKTYGSGVIESVASLFEIEKDIDGKIKRIKSVSFDESCIEETDKKIIQETVELLDQYGTFELVEFTHQHAIWAEYEEEILAGKNLEYSIKEIEDFFKLHPEDQLWKHQL